MKKQKLNKIMVHGDNVKQKNKEDFFKKNAYENAHALTYIAWIQNIQHLTLQYFAYYKRAHKCMQLFSA